ncbi:MAG: hypothetical protein C4334_02585 [Pyrinomonas sp.]|uniref:anti-sigma factor n=1 Tax=Pyrinomonas sp. TaxID=2080306 RepID=UPI00332E53E5
MNHEEFTELIELEALGQLDESQRRALEEHLESCAACREEFAQTKDAVAMLAYLVPPTAPPERARRKIIARIRRERFSLISSEPRTNDRRQGRPWWRWGLLAASLALLVFGTLLLLLWQERQRTKEELARRESAQRQLQEQIKVLEENLERERQLRQLLSDPNTRVVELSGTNVAPQARAKLAYDARTGRAVLFATDLPPTPPDKAYQLWYITPEGNALPGNVFRPEAGGRAEIAGSVPSAGRAVKVFAVTLEPATGMPAPTGEKFLIGTIS